MSDRIASAKLRDKVMSAEEAVQFVNHGDKVGTSGFTGAGYPKAMPAAIAEKAKAAHEKGQDFSIDMYTGSASATPAAARCLEDRNGSGVVSSW